MAAARTDLERTLALYDPERHHSLAFLYVQDLRVAALSALSWTLFAMGYPEQARARSHEALDAARELAHLMGASGQNQISTLATAMSALNQ